MKHFLLALILESCYSGQDDLDRMIYLNQKIKESVAEIASIKNNIGYQYSKNNLLSTLKVISNEKSYCRTMVEEYNSISKYYSSKELSDNKIPEDINISLCK